MANASGTGAEIRVVVWNENRHEQINAEVAARYPQGIHGTIKDGIEKFLRGAASVSTATLDEVEHGLTQERLDATDVLVWWGHIAHSEVSDVVVERIQQAVLAGMGLVVLHSGHESKLFQKLMGTSCSLRWRNDNDRELVWTVDHTHPIVKGIPHPIVIEGQEMYGEQFDIPTPDELVFISSFSGGEVFRSGCTFRRGNGKIFYFSPGDEAYPVYHQEAIQHVIANGVEWSVSDRPSRLVPVMGGRHFDRGEFFRGSENDGSIVDLTGGIRTVIA